MIRPSRLISRPSVRPTDRPRTRAATAGSRCRSGSARTGCRCPGSPCRPQVGGMSSAELGHLAANMGDEGVGVGPGPGAVLVGVGIGRDRRLDPVDQRLHRGAAMLDDDARRVAGPVAVDRAHVLADRGGAAPHPPADHLIALERARALALHRDPAVHGQDALPAPGARRVDLDHGFRRDRRVGGEAGAVPARLAPMGDRAAMDHPGGPEQRRDHQKEETTEPEHPCEPHGTSRRSSRPSRRAPQMGQTSTFSAARQARRLRSRR